jgi:hypothetical protein
MSCFWLLVKLLKMQSLFLLGASAIIISLCYVFHLDGTGVSEKLLNVHVQCGGFLGLDFLDVQFVNVCCGLTANLTYITCLLNKNEMRFSWVQFYGCTVCECMLWFAR